MDALTPIGDAGDVRMKRDDLYVSPFGERGGKGRVIQRLLDGSSGGVVTSGMRSSNQIVIVARACAARGRPCSVHVPSGPETEEIRCARVAGASVHVHVPGYALVVAARAREQARAESLFLVPMGLQCEDTVRLTAEQVGNLPDDVTRIVVPVGSGMSLAGILHGLKDRSISVPVLGVSVGGRPERRLDTYAPHGWRERCEIVRAKGRATGRSEYAGVCLDAGYEAHCVAHLRRGDLLWVVGDAATSRGAVPLPPSTAPVVQVVSPPVQVEALREEGRSCAAVYLHSSERMPEVSSGSVRLLVGASVHLPGADWSAYEALYRKVYLEEGARVIRSDGIFVVIQTDGYAKGRLWDRRTALATMLTEQWELIDERVWARRAADHFQVPFSHVMILRPRGGTAGRAALNRDGEWFQGVWTHRQSSSVPKSLNGYPSGLCEMLVRACTSVGDLVLDPFAGSGALLAAAARMGRPAVGYEIDPMLREVIERHGVRIHAAGAHEHTEPSPSASTGL